jgi:hypothetical protein
MYYLFCRPIIYIKVLELEIKHKHRGFNMNYEKATGVWQRFFSNPNSLDNPVCLSVQSYGTYCQQGVECIFNSGIFNVHDGNGF